MTNSGVQPDTRRFIGDIIVVLVTGAVALATLPIAAEAFPSRIPAGLALAGIVFGVGWWRGSHHD